jgi:ABC-type transporter Mla maintaining outer membrane lipid asymmetry ATPase subunit MlaF
VETSSNKDSVIEAASLDVLSRRYNRVQIAGVDWTVRRGEFWVIGAPHGSGKTNFLMTIAGFHRPAGGSLRLFGKAVDQSSEPDLIAQRQRMGFVFKGGGRMFNELTVAENVALGLCYHKNCSMEAAREEIASLLELTDLTDVAHEMAPTLGAGRQQRVGLARALALKPELMFFDEPAAGLERYHSEWWRNFLVELSAKKITIIVATNDFDTWHGENYRYGLIRNGQWQTLAKPPAEFEIK